MIARVQPLSGPPPSEVPLPRAPLVQVVAQVRFAPILAIARSERAADFQEAIRSKYPTLSQERAHQLDVAANGVPTVKEVVIWRFDGSTKSPKWRVSLGVDFVSIETSAYVSRKDFLERFDLVLGSLQRAFNPGEIQRIGLRYVDRIVGHGLEKIHEIIQPNVLGISMPNESSSTLYAAVHHLLTEAQLEAEEGLIQARWGHLPPEMSYDESALPAINESSWILDLDMFRTGPLPFDQKKMMQLATKFAERNYSVFREMVTENFLTFYGGEL